MKGLKEEIKKIYSDKNTFKKYMLMIFFQFLVASCYNLFVVPNNIDAGGAGGIGVVLKAALNINPAITIFIVCIIMFVLALLFLDSDDALTTLIVAIIYPLFVKITANIGVLFPMEEGHILMMTIIGSILTGFCHGNIYKMGLNIGGPSIIAKVICKKNNGSITLVNSIINAVIVIAGAYVIGPVMVLYAILFLMIERTISERVILGQSTNKTFKIITSKYEKVEKYIEKNLNCSVTLYDTYGTYDKEPKKMIMVVVPTTRFTDLKNYVKKIDKNAFIFVTDTYEIKGKNINDNKLVKKSVN